MTDGTAQSSHRGNGLAGVGGRFAGEVKPAMAACVGWLGWPEVPICVGGVEDGRGVGGRFEALVSF